MINRNLSKVIASFRESRGQSLEPPKPENKRKKTKGRSFHDLFLEKYADLENRIDDLKTQDLVYYFRQVAEENGCKYVISMGKDASIMKRLKESFSNREICGMIEFLYTSDQDYLEKHRLSINVLGSRWINTIYADTQLWLDDKYIPYKSKKAIKHHEWDKSVAGTANETKIGVKL